ncbi:MAG: DUF4835 family protein [Bacteroidales bacterium]|nr:DUF4835 family protein [Bacteroidales bacterium]
MKKFALCLLIFFLALSGMAQDFQCQISINSSKISGSNRNRYNALQQELYRFVNDRKWCQYNLKTNERIECAIMITLDAVSGDEFTGTMTIQLQRPIYGTSYKSTVLNFQDKNVKFTYAEGDPLEYSDNTNLSQFTSLIAFYLNLFLAVDFDTFSMNGGAPYYSKCQNIVNLNQTSKEPGWKVYESGQNNRYWIMENLTNSNYGKLHEFLYKYHRLGLDVMAESPDAGRAVIAESLRLLQDVHKQKSNIYMVQMLVHAKSDEIVNIFKQGTPSEKTQVLNIMKQIDASNQSKYNAINQQ